MTSATKVPADPRPRIVAEGGAQLLAGGRCRRCGHALVRVFPRCPRCRGEIEPASFGPEGEIWSFTVIHIPPGPGADAPYALAYVDLDDGPRVLVRTDPEAPLQVGARARLGALSDAGDPTAEVIR